MRSVAVLVTVVTAAVPAAAQDAPATAALSWEAAAGCMPGEELVRAVEAWVERPVFAEPSEAALALEGTVGADPNGGWRADIALETAGGERIGTREVVMEDDDCRALDASLVLVVALLVEHGREHVRLRIPMPEEAGTGTVTETVAEPEEEPWHFEVSSGLALVGGYLPGLAAGAVIGMAVTPPAPMRLALVADWLPGARAERDGVGADIGTFGVALSACGHLLARDGWAVGACAGLRVGRIVADSFGLGGRPPTQGVWMVDLPVTAALEARWDPAAVRAEVGAWVPLRPQRFTYDDTEGLRREVHDTSAVAPAVVISAILGLW